MAVTSKRRSKQTQSERREKTTKAILEKASELFGDRGFAKVSLEQIAAASSMTEGAIYHHYKNKMELFRAVTECQEEILAEDIDALGDAVDVESVFRIWNLFQQACENPRFVRIVLEDAPHILGRERWQESAVLAKVKGKFLQPLLRKKIELAEDDEELLLRMITSALAEAALTTARKPNYDPTYILRKIIGLTLT